jgi:dihydropteroate synthase
MGPGATAAGPRHTVPGLPTPGRCLVMGIVNVTPDSFSDGGQWLQTDAAVAHGERLLAAGADLLDVGGESTRPGAVPPAPGEELARVLPVISTLAAGGALVSVDTMWSSVAEAALNAGAVMVNDVSGGLADPAMLPLVAAAGVPYVAMHWRRPSAEMQSFAHYDDVVADVRSALAARLDAAAAAGVDVDTMVLDPGLGFAKNAEHNWRLLADLAALHSLGRPLLVGASRKSFLGRLLAGSDGQDRPPTERDDATVATTTLAAAAGAWCVRVHDAAGSADAVRVVARMAEMAQR